MQTIDVFCYLLLINIIGFLSILLLIIDRLSERRMWNRLDAIKKEIEKAFRDD